MSRNESFQGIFLGTPFSGFRFIRFKVEGLSCRA